MKFLNYAFSVLLFTNEARKNTDSFFTIIGPSFSPMGLELCHVLNFSF